MLPDVHIKGSLWLLFVGGKNGAGRAERRLVQLSKRKLMVTWTRVAAVEGENSASFWTDFKS